MPRRSRADRAARRARGHGAARSVGLTPGLVHRRQEDPEAQRRRVRLEGRHPPFVPQAVSARPTGRSTSPRRATASASSGRPHARLAGPRPRPARGGVRLRRRGPGRRSAPARRAAPRTRLRPTALPRLLVLPLGSVDVAHQSSPLEGGDLRLGRPSRRSASPPLVSPGSRLPLGGTAARAAAGAGRRPANRSLSAASPSRPAVTELVHGVGVAGDLGQPGRQLRRSPFRPRAASTRLPCSTRTAVWSRVAQVPQRRDRRAALDGRGLRLAHRRRRLDEGGDLLGIRRDVTLRAHSVQAGRRMAATAAAASLSLSRRSCLTSSLRAATNSVGGVVNSGRRSMAVRRSDRSGRFGAAAVRGTGVGDDRTGGHRGRRRPADVRAAGPPPGATDRRGR